MGVRDDDLVSDSVPGFVSIGVSVLGKTFFGETSGLDATKYGEFEGTCGWKVDLVLMEVRRVRKECWEIPPAFSVVPSKIGVAIQILLKLSLVGIVGIQIEYCRLVIKLMMCHVAGNFGCCFTTIGFVVCQGVQGSLKQELFSAWESVFRGVEHQICGVFEHRLGSVSTCFLNLVCWSYPLPIFFTINFGCGMGIQISVLWCAISSWIGRCYKECGFSNRIDLFFHSVVSMHKGIGVACQESVGDALREEVFAHDVARVDTVGTNIQTACDLRSNGNFARFCLQQERSGSLYYDKSLSEKARKPALEITHTEDVIKKDRHECSLVCGSDPDNIDWDLRSA